MKTGAIRAGYLSDTELGTGTNPASAVMAGMRVLVVGCDENGNIDLADLATKAEEHASALAALMVTYPSTHGVFEEGIVDICDIVHASGGQVYMDSANLNALVGVARPGRLGRTLLISICIRHSVFRVATAAGVGPISVRKHLKPYLPGHAHLPGDGAKNGPVVAAPGAVLGFLPYPGPISR